MEDRIRVMVIDDNELVRSALIARLTTDPRLDVVGSVGNASRARLLVERLLPDVVLIEPKSIRHDAMALIDYLHRLSERVRIIALTTFYDEDEEVFLRQLGVSQYLLKNLNQTDVLIKRIITTNQAVLH